jgi:hypothetical protein
MQQFRLNHVAADMRAGDPARYGSFGPDRPMRVFIDRSFAASALMSSYPSGLSRSRLMHRPSEASQVFRPRRYITPAPFTCSFSNSKVNLISEELRPMRDQDSRTVKTEPLVAIVIAR